MYRDPSVAIAKMRLFTEELTLAVFKSVLRSKNTTFRGNSPKSGIFTPQSYVYFHPE